MLSVLAVAAILACSDTTSTPTEPTQASPATVVQGVGPALHPTEVSPDATPQTDSPNPKSTEVAATTPTQVQLPTATPQPTATAASAPTLTDSHTPKPTEAGTTATPQPTVTTEPTPPPLSFQELLSESGEFIGESAWASLERQAFFGTSGQVYYPVDRAYWNRSVSEFYVEALGKGFAYSFSGLPGPQVNGDQITAVVSAEYITAWRAKFSADGETVYLPILFLFGDDSCSPSAIDDFTLNDELPAFTQQSRYRFTGKVDLTGDAPQFDSDYPCNVEALATLLPTPLPVTSPPSSPRPITAPSELCDIESANVETVMTNEELLTCLRRSLGIQD